MRRGLDCGELQGGALGQERPRGPAGGRPGQALDGRGSWLSRAWEVEGSGEREGGDAGLWPGGAAFRLWDLGSLPSSQGGLEDQHEILSFLPDCTCRSAVFQDVPGFLGEQWGRGPCLSPGFLEALPQPQESRSHSTLSCWNVGLEISSVVHGIGGGHLLGGWTLWDRRRGLPEKEEVWGPWSSGGPPTPQTSYFSPTHWPTPTLPQWLPPPSSILPSARPLAPRVSPPPNHIWFSLGSPKMPLSEAPPTPGEGGRRIRGD